LSKIPDLEGAPEIHARARVETRRVREGAARGMVSPKISRLEYNPTMRTIEISEKAFQVIERLRRSKGVTRAEALETLVQEGATIAQANSILDAPNPKMQDRTDDEIMQIATDAVKQDRRERRR
jgi:hypothetical protein